MKLCNIFHVSFYFWTFIRNYDHSRQGKGVFRVPVLRWIRGIEKKKLSNLQISIGVLRRRRQAEHYNAEKKLVPHQTKIGPCNFVTSSVVRRHFKSTNTIESTTLLTLPSTLKDEGSPEHGLSLFEISPF